MTDVSEILDTAAAKSLIAYIERIESLEEEKKALSDDIREEYNAAKGQGFDPKIMKVIVKLRKKSSDEIQEEDALLEVYRQAVGMTS